MPQSSIKKVFPGGNTARGFYSYYDHVIGPEATRIMIIKGGPGVGKSTFMRAISDAMFERGYSVEHHHCSSDNNSLDGMVIPAIGVALIDGTAPHILDPRNPGAVDEIVNLGDFWDEERMRANKEAIVATTRRVGRLFGMAYRQLAEAGLIRGEERSYVSEAVQAHRVNKITGELIQEVINPAPGQFQRPPKARHLFGSAISPAGVVNHYETLLQDTCRLFILKGSPGTGRAQVMRRLADAAVLRGLDTEVYHCALFPEEIDLLVVPAIAVAFLKQVEEVKLNREALKELEPIELDCDQYIDRELLAPYVTALMAARERFRAALARGIHYLREAKLTHDYLENFYVSHMDFEAIAAKREETLARILKWAEEAAVGNLPKISAGSP